MLSLLTAVLLQSTSTFTAEAHGTGLEWMTIASVVVPAVLLVVLIYLGSKSTVK
jgi:hypothetical protein